MSHRQKSAQSLALSTLKYVVLIVGATLMMVPFFWMLSSSSMSSAEIMARPLTWFPAHFRWGNLRTLAHSIPLGHMYVNSLIVTTATTLGILFTSSLAGYGFAKFQFPGRDFLFIIVLATMMIPFFVVLIPIFYIVHELGWINSYAGLIVPNIVTAFGIFLMRQYMLSLPDEVLDAARLDGASEFEIYWRMVIPLCTPVLGALGILAYVYQWNNFLWPLIVVRSSNMWTIPVGLNSLREFASDPGVINLQMAGAAAAIVPVVIVFLFLQRYFTQGIALTGMKG